jgi:ubiquinone/menaquinone biosynthesis C-methylase UbiE
MAYQNMKFEGDYLEQEYRKVKPRLESGESMETINPIKVYRHRAVARSIAERLAGGAGRPSVLEVGCGGSVVLHELSKLGVRCHGVDMNPIVLDYSRVLKASYGSDVEYSQEDAFKLPFPDGAFDLVFSVGMLEHYSPADQLLLIKECKRVAKRFVQVDIPNEGPDSSMLFILKGHEDSHLPTDLVKLATDAGLVEPVLEGRGLFVPKFGTEANSEAYQQFMRARFPQLVKDMTSADIEVLIETEHQATKEELLRYGSMHFMVGRVA